MDSELCSFVIMPAREQQCQKHDPSIHNQQLKSELITVEEPLGEVAEKDVVAPSAALLGLVVVLCVRRRAPRPDRSFLAAQLSE